MRFANQWLRAAIAKEPRVTLDIGRAIAAASVAFAEVMGKEGVAGVNYPVNVQGRLDAGFTADEVRTEVELQQRQIPAHERS